MKNLKGKTAVVTGAASGIGRELAYCLAEKGCNLALSDVNEKGLAETVSNLPAKVRVTQDVLDVADRVAFYDYAERMIKAHDGVDIVINNAGVAVTSTIEDLSYDDMEWIVNINLWGVVYGTKAFLPHLKTRAESHVVNISSVFGIVSLPEHGAYNMTKFAVKGFTESLRQEMAGTSVGVTCVHPGGIKTNIAKAARHSENTKVNTSEFEKNFHTSAKSAAKQIVSAITGNKKRILVGLDAKAVDIVQRLLPKAYESIIGRLMKG